MIPDYILLEILLFHDRKTLEILQLACHYLSDFVSHVKPTSTCLRPTTSAVCGGVVLKPEEIAVEIELLPTALSATGGLRETLVT